MIGSGMENRERRPPLRLRVLLALAISLTVSVGAVLYALYISRQQTVRLEVDLRSEATALAESAAGSLEYSLLTFDTAEIEASALRFARFSDLRALRVADARGELITAVAAEEGRPPRVVTGNRLWQSGQGPAQTEQMSLDAQRNLLQVLEPIRLSDRTLGWVQIDYSLRRLQEGKEAIWRTSISVGLVLLVAINAILIGVLERPLRALERLTRFAAGLGQHIGATIDEPPSVREVSSLQSALNTASRRLAQQQQALVAARLRLQMMLDHAGDAVLVTDHEGRVTLFNPAAERLFGWTSREAVGFTFNRLLPELQVDVDPSTRRETWGLHHDGRPLELELSVSAVDEESGTRQRIFVVRDVSARKDLERQWRSAKELAETANRAKSEFLANMSHEIRTPMNGVIGMVELLLDTPMNSEQREYLQLIKSSANVLLEIINDILDFSKIEAGRLELEKVNFNPRGLAREVMQTLAVRAAEKQLELILDVGDTVPAAVLGDPLRLRQVLVNLVGNAIKFTAIGEVALTMRLIGDDPQRPTLYVGVLDTGIGIAPDKQKVIFEAFTQADSSTTRQFGGTGLGLAISHRLVDIMGGELNVQSKVGEGSLFQFTIELLPGITSGDADPVPVATLAGHPLVIVDDNETNRRLLLSMAHDWGMPVRAAASADAGIVEMLRMLAEFGKPPLVILDGHMPGRDGFDFARQVRDTADLAAAPIVMLTSGPRQGDQALAQQLRLAAYLLKPVEKFNLAGVLAHALGGKMLVGEQTAIEVSKRPPIRRLQILAAEDNAVNQRLISTLLTRLGHHVDLAGNGEEAINLYRRQPFDLVLMDVQMPVLGGLEATQRIRELELVTGKHVPIVAMTANALSGDKDKCLASGMDDYLAKPIQLNQLLMVLDRVASDGAVVYVPPTLPPTLIPAVNESRHSVLDPHIAIERLGGDPSIYRQLIELYFDDRVNQLTAIEQSLQARDARKFERAAHSLKGVLASLGAEAARDVAYQLERAGKGEDWERAALLHPRLETLTAEADSALQAWLAEN